MLAMAPDQLHRNRLPTVILSLGTALRAVDGGRNLGSSRTGLNGPDPHKHWRFLRSRRNRGGGGVGGSGGGRRRICWEGSRLGAMMTLLKNQRLPHFRRVLAA